MATDISIETGADDDPTRPNFCSKEEWEAFKEVTGLTKRHAEVVGLKVQGKEAKEIQEILEISGSTLRDHLYESRDRLSASTVKEIPYRAVEAILVVKLSPRQK
ncbi:MAG TPA: helix-turn-helix transcriptional regulator [Pirellulales bacterium]|jgi:DNA-binding CsgD family transcriptional regulator